MKIYPTKISLCFMKLSNATSYIIPKLEKTLPHAVGTRFTMHRREETTLPLPMPLSGLVGSMQLMCRQYTLSPDASQEHFMETKQSPLPAKSCRF